MNQKNRFVFFGIILIIIIVLHFFGIHRYFTLTQLRKYALILTEFVNQHYWQAVIFYLALFIGATIIALPITIILTITAGYLFGTLLGALYAILGATIGAMITFLSVRYFIGKWIQKRYVYQLQRFNQETNEYGARYLLVLQLIPFTPTFLINTLVGLTKISSWTFFWTTLLGILPGTLIYTWAGNQLHLIKSIRDIASFSIIFILLLCSLFLFITILWRRK